MIVDPLASLPPEYQSRVRDIIAKPAKRGTRTRPKRHRVVPQRAAAHHTTVTQLSQRTKAVLQRTFRFWCTQLDSDEPSGVLSARGWCAFCRVALVRSEDFTQRELLEIFNACSEQRPVDYDTFLMLLQAVADRVANGDLGALLSEYVLPHTAGVCLSRELRLIFSEVSCTWL